MVKGLYLTLLAGPDVPVPVPHVMLDALTGIEVTTADEGSSGFQLSFTLNNRSPLLTFFLLSGNSSQLRRMRVIIVVTLNGTPSVLMDGIVTHQQVAPGSDTAHSTLTVTGEDLSALMDRGEIVARRFPGLAAHLRVLGILAKYAKFGIVPNVQPSVTLSTPGRDDFPAQRSTDLAYIRKLAQDTGHVFYIDFGSIPGTSTAYWGPQYRLGAPQPALNVNMDAFSNVESLSFSFDSRSTTRPIVRVQDADNKRDDKVEISDLNALRPPLALIPPLPLAREVVDHVAKLSNADASQLATARAARSADALTASGRLDVLRYGRILKARDLVGVRGAGLAFDGLHFVKRVTHNIKPGEYKQSFALSRNGLMPTVSLVPV